MNDPDLHTEPLLREKLYLVGPIGSGISPEHPVDLDSVADKPLILTPRPDCLRTLIEMDSPVSVVAPGSRLRPSMPPWTILSNVMSGFPFFPSAE
ncbi:hypothetical protein [Rhizobium sp. RU36D]|uniref:hypothetical protein n=1 Tax=Rhizobium sp. RU36D TaxID=1907415 RepID=UPI001179D2D0|nr:hypothetical protein [Rhizobium sp. RU36D]